MNDPPRPAARRLLRPQRSARPRDRVRRPPRRRRRRQLWIIEDCFYTAGVSLAATALATTERLTVGIGILPAVARNPAITAMEIATLAGWRRGGSLAGIGHGVQSWMEQMGVRPPSR